MADTLEYQVQHFGGVAMQDNAGTARWLNERAAEGWVLLAVDGGTGYFTRALTAPTNTTLPHVSQTGNTLHCTMGEWSHDPTSYAYQWQLDGVVVGGVTGHDSPDYTRVAGDVGKTATCVVTASNASGSTAAQPSNGVVVT
jgi:hypothetical protein